MAKIIVSEPQNIVLGISFNEKKQLLVNLNKRKDGNLEWRIPGCGVKGHSKRSISSTSRVYVWGFFSASWMEYVTHH
jgi:hypothetical protein